MLHITARLRSSRNSMAFQMAENLRSSICFLVSTRRADALNLQRNNIELHMRRFLRIPKSEPKEDKEKSRAYFDALCYSGIPSLLVSLYLSPVEVIHGIGLRTIRIFLNSKDAFLPEYMHFQAKGHNDHLYIECWSTLANFLSAQDIVPLGCTKLLLDVYLFIAGLVSLEDVALSRDTKQVSLELYSFFWAMEGTVKNWRNTKDAISKKFFQNGNPEYEKGIGLLYELFMKLLSKVGRCLKKVEDIMDQKGHTKFVNELAAWSHFLVVLTLVRNFSKIVEAGKQLLDLLIFERQRVLKVLVRHARTDYMLFMWSLKYKYLTDFDTRKEEVSFDDAI
ncbi:uncharacterized protein LOC141823715 [Curcuma longa]|uniref:uncharacterized protein LOC141823715 n=1 Tax=Curcuma longa TaxID=136217 RepID=UPI003D9DB155